MMGICSNQGLHIRSASFQRFLDGEASFRQSVERKKRISTTSERSRITRPKLQGLVKINQCGLSISKFEFGAPAMNVSRIGLRITGYRQIVMRQRVRILPVTGQRKPKMHANLRGISAI